MRTTTLVCFTCSLMALACSSDDGGSDATIQGDGGVVLWACSEPGKPCNAHDNCAINPICGDDGYCRPQRYQNCDDGLDCTTDTCEGQGLCRHEPAPGQCLVLVPGELKESCVAEGMVKPDDACRVCNPNIDSGRWSPRNGGECDDEDPCTKDDTCREGICRGTFFGNQCTDNLVCTLDVCNADGSCQNPLEEGTCLIAGVCYSEGDRDGDGCQFCNSTADAYEWTPLTKRCVIGSRCYAPGDLDGGGCGVCDPDVDEDAWSRTPDTCLVDSVCYQLGEEGLFGCGVCDPSRSTEALSPAIGSCRIADVCYAASATSPSTCGECRPPDGTGDDGWRPVGGAQEQRWVFASGLDGFVAAPASGAVAWRHASGEGHSAPGSLYYGNASFDSYDSGEPNSGEARSPSITLPAGQHAALHFWLFLDTEASEQFDRLEVLVDNAVAWRRSAQTFPLSLYRRWVAVEVDLSAHAGETISVAFSFASGDGFSNKGRGVFIDDVAVLTQCGAL